jgi:hypothetical protein
MEALRIFEKSSFERAFKKLTPDQKAAVRQALIRLPDSVGKPQLHAGLGIRSFGKYLECRAGLKIRVLFIFSKATSFWRPPELTKQSPVT